MTQASTTLNRGQSGLMHRGRRWAGVLSLEWAVFVFLQSAIYLSLLMSVTAAPALARVHHNDAWARQEFAKAERMREALNGRPVGERTRHEYQRVIDAYRRVYFGSPTSSKADPSVVATAELMVEMGRRFDDDKILRGAVDEYRFLRKEYPGSKYRFDALFTIGEIYKDDLNDPEEAQKTFQDFLHRYPRNRLAEDARSAIKDIDETEASARTARKGHGGTAGEQTAESSANGTSSAGPGAPGERRNGLPRVTGVRHWSTPDYTRVAIDVEQEVKFNSQRIANPDRIFFDLRDTKLASTLVGKTFDVDDGFLKKIRVAEFKPGQTRIVLEVDDLSRYDAFLLPDPYRLIIDIHGKQSRATTLAKAQRRGTTEAEAGGESSVSLSSSSSMPDSAAAASLESVGEAGDLEAEKKGQVKSEKEHAIVAKVDSDDDAGGEQSGAEQRSRSIKDELRKERSADGTGSPMTEDSSGVVKTTVAVKGTNRRIPKTIVAADDDDTATKPENGKKRGTGNSASGNSASGDSAPRGGAAHDAATVGAVSDATIEEAKLSTPDDVAPVTTGESAGKVSSSSKLSSSGASASSSSPSSSSGSSRRKKSRSSSSSAADAADLEAREARPTAAGSRSLTRALGLKIGKIVIDAGHGGHDTGTIGPNGLEEKDLVLDVAKRLGRLLEARLGAEVIYTRQDDTFIPLETRTAIANREQADLFISIHANSSRDEDARGVETYYLNFTSSPEALEVAARENAVSEESVHELQDLVKKIALKEKIDESREFASDVQDSLYGGLALRNAGIRNRGVKKAPFIVLIGANMPSILAEISFVSNPTDERKLETSEQRQRIAESLYRGVARYASGLSGVKVASKIERTEGQ
jgi:N-acetylmuramoyl-L-alanine amidase